MSKGKVFKWYVGLDTGLSSISLAFEYLGEDYSYVTPPSDPADLGRCLRLIRIVPEIRGCVDALALKHDGWANAARVWDIMAQSMADEVGIHWQKANRAPLTYKLMKEAGL